MYQIFYILWNPYSKIHSKTNWTIFLKLKPYHAFNKYSFWSKKNLTVNEPVQIFLGIFFQKINFFQKFWHFWNHLNELVRKMVLFFKFDELCRLTFFSPSQKTQIGKSHGKILKNAHFCTFWTVFNHFEATSDFSNKIISIQGTV